MVQKKAEKFMCSGCAKIIDYWGGELAPCSCGKGTWEKLIQEKLSSSEAPEGICSVCGGDLEIMLGGVVAYRCTKCGHHQSGRSPVIGI